MRNHKKKEVSMGHLRKILYGVTLLAVAATLGLLPEFAGSRPQQMAGMDHSNPNEPVPAFHPQPPQDSLPPTMEPSIFSDKVIFNAYTVAGRVKKVLYQEPCYCHCDRSQGHGSLLDCFVSRHGAGCDTCVKEAFYAYEQTHKGKSAQQIREGIIRGDWEKLDVAKYQSAYLPPTNK
jgi:Protein of unknown function with PCYCGC motif